MMLPPKVMRSTMAAHKRGSVKVRVQPLKFSLEAVATLAFSSLSVSTWNRSPAPRAVPFHVAELVDVEQVNAAVPVDGLGELAVVGGLDQLVDEPGGQGVLDAVAGHGCLSAQGDEQMGLAGAGVEAVPSWRVAGLQSATGTRGRLEITMRAADGGRYPSRGHFISVTPPQRLRFELSHAARRTFDIAHAWGGKHPMDVPMVVVTHRVPQEWADREGSPFTFVTDGVPKAIEVAREIAGGKDVVVGAPSVTQQCLQLGLLDAIHIDLAPVVLGRGIRLFDHLTKPIEFLATEASGDPHVTHLTYRVIR